MHMHTSSGQLKFMKQYIFFCYLIHGLEAFKSCNFLYLSSLEIADHIQQFRSIINIGPLLSNIAGPG